MTFRTVKRINKTAVNRITIPAQAMKILGIQENDTLEASYDYPGRILYYHPTETPGNIYAGSYKVAQPKATATVVLPKEFCNTIEADFVVVTIDPDKWTFTVGPEK